MTGTSLARFKTDKNYYYFDPNTSEILSLTESMWNVLPFLLDHQPISDSEIECRLQDVHDSHTVRSALEMVRKAQSAGHLQPFHHPVTKFDESSMQSELDKGLQQITLAITETCNFRCRYCAYSGNYKYSRKHSANSMSFETARKAIDYFLERCVSGPKMNVTAPLPDDGKSTACIGFYGGEPLLEKALLVKCLEYATTRAQRLGKELFFTMTTNGSICDDEVLDLLAHYEVFITISLDGPRAIHDQNRVYANGRGTYDDVIAFLRQVHSYNSSHSSQIRYSISCVRTPPLEISTLMEYFAVQPDEQFQNVGPVGHGPLSPNAAKEQLYTGEITGIAALRQLFWDRLRSPGFREELEDRKWREELKFASVFVARPFETVVQRHTKPSLNACKEKGIRIIPGAACVIGKSRIFVTVDGVFLPCEKAEEGRCSMIIGDVDNGLDVSRICHLMNEYLSSTDYECARCWAMPICTASCIAFCGGDDDGEVVNRAKKLASCERAKEHTLEALKNVMATNEVAPDFFDRYKKMM